MGLPFSHPTSASSSSARGPAQQMRHRGREPMSQLARALDRSCSQRPSPPGSKSEQRLISPHKESSSNITGVTGVTGVTARPLALQSLPGLKDGKDAGKASRGVPALRLGTTTHSTSP